MPLKLISSFLIAFQNRPKLINKIIHLNGLREFNRSIIVLKKLLRVNPNDEFALYCMGYIFQQTGEFKKSTEYLQKAIKLNQSNSEYYFRLGLSFFSLNQYNEALESLKKAEACGLNNSDLYKTISSCYIGLNQYNEAIKYLNKIKVDDATIIFAEVLSVKQWCEKSRAQYQQISPPIEIIVKKPKCFNESTSPVEGRLLSNEHYVAQIKNARIFYNSNLVVVDDKQLLYENLVSPFCKVVNASYDNPILGRSSNTDNEILIVRLPTEDQTTREVRAIWLCGLFSNEYGHWLYEFLPKLRYLELSEKYSDYPICIHEDLHPNCIAALTAIVGMNRKLIKIQKNKSIIFDELITMPTSTFMPSAVFEGTKPTVEIGAALKMDLEYLRLKILENFKDKKPGLSIKVFLARKQSRWRNLNNQQQLIDYFEKRDFKTVYCEDMSFEEMIQLMQNADFVVGPSGSAMNNTIFCKLGTKVLILSPPSLDNYSSWGSAMNELKIPTFFICGETIDKKLLSDKHSDYYIKVVDIKKSLNFLKD